MRKVLEDYETFAQIEKQAGRVPSPYLKWLEDTYEALVSEKVQA